MASQANPGNRGTTQTGYGKHADRRTKRARTRGDQVRGLLAEWDDVLTTEGGTMSTMPGPGKLWPECVALVESESDPLAAAWARTGEPEAPRGTVVGLGVWVLAEGRDRYAAADEEIAGIIASLPRLGDNISTTPARLSEALLREDAAWGDLWRAFAADWRAAGFRQGGLAAEAAATAAALAVELPQPDWFPDCFEGFGDLELG